MHSIPSISSSQPLATFSICPILGKGGRHLFQLVGDLSYQLFALVKNIVAIALEFFKRIAFSFACSFHICAPRSDATATSSPHRTTERYTNTEALAINQDIALTSPSLMYAFPPTRQDTDVFDDGNCLFYSLTLGILQKYKTFPHIQEKLNWLPPNLPSLKDLGKSETLKTPAQTLRQQAAHYLDAHFVDKQTGEIKDPEIMVALMEGVSSHADVARRKITDEENFIRDILLPDIQWLIQQLQASTIQEQLQKAHREIHAAIEKMQPAIPDHLLANLEAEIKQISSSPTIQAQLHQKCDQLKATNESLKFLKAHLPSGDNLQALQAYIEITKEDRVYCGAAQIFAIAREYEIPIRILYRYGEPDQFEQIFNEDAHREHPQKPLLTIVHVNHNHFRYLDDDN